MIPLPQEVGAFVCIRCAYHPTPNPGAHFLHGIAPSLQAIPCAPMDAFDDAQGSARGPG
jgi:hypothetical protein